MDWLSHSGANLVLHVRVTPNAGEDGTSGLVTRADGRRFLAIRTKAVPDKGRANKAVIAILAKTLGIAKSSIAITTGSQSREKSLLISEPSENTIARLMTLAKAPD